MKWNICVFTCLKALLRFRMYRFIMASVQIGSSGFILVNLFGMQALDMLIIWSVIY